MTFLPKKKLFENQAILHLLLILGVQNSIMLLV